MSLDKESSDNDKSCGQIKQDPEEIKQELAISGHGPAVIDPLARPWDEILSITSIDVQPDIDRLLLRRRDEEIHSLLINSSELPTVIGVIDIEVYPQFCWDIDIMPAEKPIQAIVRLSLLRALGKVSRRLLGTEYDSSILGPEGRFIGPLHRIEETDALNNAMIRSHDENVFNSVKRTMKIATRLATICEIVGEGCIFVLYKELTDDLYVLSHRPIPQALSALGISVLSTS